MKNKLVFLIVLIISLIFIGIGKVDALQIDTSLINYNFKQDGTDIHSHSEIILEGIEFSSKYDYCITFTNNSLKPEISNDTISMDVWSCSDDKSFVLNDLMLKIYESKSDIYLWIASSNDNNAYDISNSIKIKRLDYFEIGKRIYANYISGEESDLSNKIFLKDEIYTKNSINYKIGIIHNKDIIQNMEDVLNYAKNDNEGKTGTVSFSNIAPIYNSINNYDSGKYYYVYFYFDDYDLEDVNYYTYDVSLKVLSAGKINHINLSSNGSIKNPSTDDSNVVLITIISILVFAILLFSSKRLKKLIMLKN